MKRSLKTSTVHVVLFWRLRVALGVEGRSERGNKNDTQHFGYDNQ